ncbi:MAG: glycosyltransferase 87 family protein [Planctomycetota bacterium]
MLLLLAVVAVLGGWYFGARAKGDDRELPVYVAGGERMAAGAEIYRRQAGPGVDADKKPFTYPPFAAAPFVPYALLPAAWQAPLWFVVNFVIVLGLARWLHRHAGRADPALGPPRPVAFWLLVGVVGGRHVASVFTNQSHDLIVAGLLGLAAAAWARGRARAGAWVGLAAAFKATPLLLLGLFGLRRRWLAVALLLAAAVGATLLPDWLLPRSDGGSWVVAWFERTLRGLDGGAAKAEGAWDSHSFLNQSLGGTFVRLFQPSQSAAKFVLGEPGTTLLAPLPAGVYRAVLHGAQLAGLAALTLATLRAATAVREAGRSSAGGAFGVGNAVGAPGAGNAVNAGDAVGAAAVRRTVALGEVGAFACGMLLLSPMSSKSHFCVWVFPVAFLAEGVLRGRRDALATALFVAAAVVGLLAKDLLGKSLGNVVLAYGNATWATVLLLLATVRQLGIEARAAGAAR